MSFFKKNTKKEKHNHNTTTLDDTVTTTQGTDQDLATHNSPITHGPYDIHDSHLPENQTYLDLGGLKIPGRDGLGLRLTANDDHSLITDLTIVYHQSSLQIQAFAAPKTMGIWDATRTSIIQSSSTANAREVDGYFGKEILLDIPAPHNIVIPTRVVGIDGPRWMLRGIFTGTAARESEDKKILDDFFAHIIVNRGTKPLAPRDPIELIFPEQLLPQETPDIQQTAINDPLSQTDDVHSTVNVQTVLERGPMFSEMR